MSNTERAVAKLRETAEYIANNAESLVGDMDGVYVVEGGLRFEFTLCDDATIPTVTVTKEHIVYEREQ